MRCSIMQPTYLPWIGYFNLIKNAEIFVVYDSAQFSKQSWQQRNKLRSKDSELMLTIPVVKNPMNTKINEILINNEKRVLKKHLKTIKLNYSKSNNFDKYISEIENIYNRGFSKLIDLNLELIRFGCKVFDIKTKILLSSNIDYEGEKNNALISMCKQLNIDTYVSPEGAKDYIDIKLFEKNNINLEFQKYNHPVYNQIDFKNFISHLSFIDFLFNNKTKNFKKWI